MNNQIQTKLGDVADIITGPFGSQLHKSDYVQSGIACIMPQNIGNRTLNKQGIAYVSPQDANRLKRYAVRKNDIVYARRGDVEKHAYIYPIDSDSLCGTGCMRVRVDSSKADPLYVSFYLNRPETKRWISQHAVGSNMPNINSGILNDVPLSLPTLYEQTQISKFLEAIDKKISNSNQVCAELESMAKTLYDYWFVQFDFPDENGKPYRTSGGKMVWNDQLKREIPKGWGLGKIKHLGSIVSGGTPSTKHEEYYCDCGFAWITPNDLSGNEGKMFIGHGERDVTQDGIDNSSATLMPKGAVLLSTRAPIGYLAISENELSTNQGFKSIVPDAGYSEYYIYYLLLRNIPALEKQGVGTTFKEISKDTLAEFEVLLPSKTIANKFAESIQSACELRAKLEKENRELTKLRDWLLPMLMNGQATVITAPADTNSPGSKSH